MKKSFKEKMADKENMTISESDEALFNAKVRTAIKNGWNKKASITHTNKGIKFYEARFERDNKMAKGGEIDDKDLIFFNVEGEPSFNSLKEANDRAKELHKKNPDIIYRGKKQGLNEWKVMYGLNSKDFFDSSKELVVPAHKKGKGGKADTQLHEMVEGYKEALLFSLNDDEDNPLDSNYSNSDFAPATNIAIEEMLKKFIHDNAGTIESSGMDYAQIGRDIWYTQAGHGAGFFDRGLDNPIEERLIKSAKDAARFPEVEIDSDNKIHVRGVEKYEHGGKLRTPKEFNKLVAEKQRIVEKLSPKEIADMWNKNAYGVIKGASIPWTEEEAKKDTAKMYLRNLLVENELSEEEHEKYFQGGGEIPKSEFVQELQDKIQAIIPKSGVHVRVWKGFGQPSIYIQTTLGKDKSEYPNGIIQNDAWRTSISIIGVDELGNPKEKMEVNSDSGFFFVKSTVPHLAYERIKTGWRNFSGNKEQVMKKIVDYFKKAKLILLENKDKLDDYAKNLVEQKYSQAKMQKGGEVPIVKYKINRALTNPEVAYMESRGLVVDESYWEDADEENNIIKLSTSAGAKEKSKSEIEAIFKDALGSKKEYKGTVVEKMQNGGELKNKYEFYNGDVVWDRGNKSYGVILNNFDNPTDGERGEIRLDSDGIQSIFEYDENSKAIGYNLVPYGSKEDNGDGDLSRLKAGAKKLIESNKEYSNERYKEYSLIYCRLLSGEFDKKKSSSGSMQTGGETKWRTGKKRFSIDYNVGKAKYVISYHKGGADNKHKDGSDFFDIKLFNNKKDFEQFKEKLLSDGYVEEYSSGGSAATGGKLPKSAQVKKIEQQIAALEESMNSSLTSQFPELKDKMQKKIDDLKKLHKDLSVKVATKQKMDLENGKFYVEIPTSVKNELYLKLRDKGVKVKWKSLGDTTRAIANNKVKQARVYQVYSQILSKENKQVPAFETISGKLTK